ncbi:MAG: hypothetical protein KDH09_16875 [Chrysiogenetes bacterium]|nr:hypothetical protein [Chrysiogenetes bacterium]
MTDRGYKRRKMFIDTREQVTFAIRSTAHVGIFLLAACILIYGPGEGGRLSGIQRITNEFLYNISDRLWFLIPAFALVWMISVIGSHRVVGPVFGFKNALRSVVGGDLTTRLTPRAGDHFAELAALINHVIDVEHDNVQALAEARGKLNEALGESGEVKDAAAAREAAAELGEILGRYKL